MARRAFLDAVKSYIDAVDPYAIGKAIDGSRNRLLEEIAIEEGQEAAPWRRILVALDHYDHPALKVAVALANAMGAELTFVSVVDVSATLMCPEVYMMTADPLKPLHEQAMEVLERSRDLVPVNIPVSLQVREGHVGTEISEAARTWNADVIILGTHRRGPLGRLIFGSTCAGVIPKTQCPVLLVTDDPHSQETAGSERTAARHN